MTIFEIIGACVGFLLCAIVGVMVLITVFGIACWVFKTEVDITPEYDREEEK